MSLSQNNNVNDEWSAFISTNYNDSSDEETPDISGNDSEINEFVECPKASEIYISTKSKIAYLTEAIDLSIFWDLKIIPYSTATNGIIKKQIKFNSKTQEELNFIQNKIKNELYYEENIMSHIDNPNGRIKFKDTRKISIGLSKKDIMTYRSKKKQAFYNCFVLIIRLKIDDMFKEFHIKVFNTGKLEIPGVQNDMQFESVLKYIVHVLQPHVSKNLSYKQTSDTVLINSNFNCGFYINREILVDILKTKYKIHAIYDPCSYPGIQCKFYYKKDEIEQNGIPIQGSTKKKKVIKRSIQSELKFGDIPVTPDVPKNTNIVEVSFMIFRTGSVLIVGMCEDDVLIVIYEFLKEMLKTEFVHICQQIITSDNTTLKNKNKKIRRKTIAVTYINDSCESTTLPTITPFDCKSDVYTELLLYKNDTTNVNLGSSITC